MAAAHAAIDRRDFAAASNWLEAATGIAAPPNLANLQASLAAARGRADTEAWGQLLKSAEERLQQDRLVEPADDSAKHYWSALRGLNPNNPDLKPLTEEFGTRLVAKARRALTLKQYEAARSWLDEATSIGYESTETTAARAELETALAQQRLLANVVAANELSLVKSVKPVYPREAEQRGTEGWVELEFTVAETGAVTDVAVLNASPRGVFDAGGRRRAGAMALQADHARFEGDRSARAHPHPLQLGRIGCEVLRPAHILQAAEMRACDSAGGSRMSAPISAPSARSSAAPNVCLRISPHLSISTRLGVPRIL